MLSLNLDQLDEDGKFIYKEIFEWNVYAVYPPDFIGKTVLDIGANTGLFSLFCLQYQPKLVVGVEANPNNFYSFVKNTLNYSNIKVFNNACSSKTGETVFISNKGACSQIGLGNIPVNTISLEDFSF